VEFFLTDVEKTFHTTVSSHYPSTEEGKAENPDLRLRGDQIATIGIFNSESINEAIKHQLDEGNLQAEIISDMKDLADRGYLSLYDNIR